MIKFNSKKILNKAVNNHPFYIICALFLILFIIKIRLATNFSGPFIFPDEAEYNSITRNIVAGKLYGKLGVFSPGYPILLSLAYYVSDNQIIVYHMMLVISTFVSSTIIFPSYFILKKYCSKTVTFLGSIAVSTLTSLNFFSFTLMTEVLFTPLFLFSIWFILKSYETKNKKWALLASISIVYLYITRPTGLAMMIAFVLTFIYYIIVNVKNERALTLNSEKKIIILSFIFFLLLWIIYSTGFVDIHQPFDEKLRKTYDYGSAYNIPKYLDIYQSFNGNLNKAYHNKSLHNSNRVSKHGITNSISIGNLLTFIKLLSNLFDYLLVASFLFLFVILYYLILLFANKKSLENYTLSIPIFYACVSSILLILSDTIFLFEGKQTDRIIGRYIEPIVPIIIIIGTICLNNFDQKIQNKKNIIYFVLVNIPIILIMPYIFAWDNVIINVFNDLQDNPTLYAYNIFYGYPTLKAFIIFYNQAFIVPKQTILSYLLPSLLMSGYFLGTLALITFSIRNKSYINLLLVFIIISSLIFSTTLYHISVTKADDADNSIARYLANNTNSGTIYLTDLATSHNDTLTEMYIYGFWNQGDTSSIDSRNIPQNITKGYKKIFLISPNIFSYNKVAKNGNFTLYQVE